MREKFVVEGLMPERALDRLQRAGIAVFFAKKIKKTQILFEISRKDIEKTFAIYPNTCYNNSRGSVLSAYTITRVGELGAREKLLRSYRFKGIFLGVCAFFAVVFASASLVLKVEVVGWRVYEREARAVLRESGISPFRLYPECGEELLTARILAFEGVEFCSVRKIGNTVRVEIRGSALPILKNEDGDLVAPRGGIVESAVALSGASLKKAGEACEAGESLIGAYFTLEDGRTQATRAVGKVKLSCVEKIFAETEEEAKASAILLVEGLGGEISALTVENAGQGVLATVEFFLVVKKNI